MHDTLIKNGNMYGTTPNHKRLTKTQLTVTLSHLNANVLKG